MPGILPMKVIKVGTSAQSRIAQACDRCRSKKIRCDGITPCCSQCANVGFECKTSDKLSRRAFPRGYTESLEERVRSLETEVKEMKDLLDEKDEKIDILSKIHSNSPSLRRPSSTFSASSDSLSPKQEAPTPKEDTFRVQQPSNVVDATEKGSCFVGASSGRQFVDTFKAKVQESGKRCDDFKIDSFFTAKKQGSRLSGRDPTPSSSTAPPRMVSDQMINIFFQEWAPLFPVLHRPTFLEVYEQYVADPESVTSQHDLAQLNLIFGISALSAEWNKQDASAFELQWKDDLENIIEEHSLQTLQCLILAQIYTIIKADYKNLQIYRGMAVSLSQRLGLCESQKHSSSDVLTCETRKKVFWTLYTLDCFTAAMLGSPKILKEDDIHAEYPTDVDDENVTEGGFQSTLPGESTRLSSALALFKAARILSRVLGEIYPAASAHDSSLQKLDSLSNELDVWLKGLPAHLRLHFAQDKPSTNLCGSRSPILSLVFHYIRTLINRPAVGSSLGRKADSCAVALAQSSKHIVQIIRLLEERRMSFSFCLNRNQILLLAGFGLLYQTLELDRKGKLIQDSQRLLCSVTSMLERDSASGASEFKRITGAMISIDRSSKTSRVAEASAPRRKSEGVMHASKGNSKTSRKSSTIAGNASVKQESLNGRRMTAPILPQQSWSGGVRNNSQQRISSMSSCPTFVYTHPQPQTTANNTDQSYGLDLPNLDYLDFNTEQTPHSSQSSSNSSDNLRSSYDPNRAPSDTLLSSTESFPPALSPLPSEKLDWTSDLWEMPTNMPPALHSALSFSEEELTSGEELSSCDLNGTFNGIKIPQESPLVELGNMDGNFDL